MSDELLAWIRRGLEQPDRTQRGLARALDLDPSAVSRLLRGQRRLRAEEMRRVASYLGMGPPDLGGEPVTKAASPTNAQQETVELPATADPEGSRVSQGLSPGELPRDVPVHGIAVGGSDGTFLLNGEVVDFVRRPPGVANAASVFAVYVSGDSMSPRYDPGDLVFLHPHRPAVAGCDVVVEMHGESEGEPGVCMIKRLLQIAPNRLYLAQFNPPRDDIEIDRAKVRHVFRVLSAAELLGV